MGRLIQTRLYALQHPRQVIQVQTAVIQALARLSRDAIICTDWRKIDVFAPEVAEAVIGMLNVTNGRVQRGAILLHPDKATFNLQVERVLRDANNPARKSFRNAEKLLAWLSAILEPNELDCAHEFLSID